MQQSFSKVKNPDGFIRKAIRENWSPTPIPIKLPKNSSKRLYDLTQQEFDNHNNQVNNQQSAMFPLYNWLEE